MNFLLHRHFAKRELDSSAAGVGAMLPDLWRMASRSMRAKSDVVAVGSPIATALQAGVAHHLESDAWFHRTTVFRDGERELKRALLPVGASKLPLFAHPAWEMCLDGALLLEEDFTDTLTALRRDFDEVDDELAEVASMHGSTSLPPSHPFDERMTRLVRGVVDGRWIQSYQNGPGLAQCVAGMRKRFDLPAFTEEEESITACVLEDAVVRAREMLPALYADRKREIAR